jgi:predicted dehydrogenase
MKTEKIRCGVAGVGYLGRHHARLYSSLPGVEWIGLFDTNHERANEVAEEFGGDVFSSLEALADACDAVSVVVPTQFHADVALKLLDRGCHLLIEKPLSATRDEAELILQAARRAGTVVQVGHIEHFNPVAKFLKTAVTDPRFITVERLAPFNPRGTDVGVVLDLMIHDLGIVLKLVPSRLKRVESVGVQVLSPSEDIANARLVFESGCVVNLNTSRVSEKKVREIRVFQPAGYLSLDFMNQTGHLLRMTPQGLQREEIPIEKDEPLKLELQAFVECVSEAQKPEIDASFGKEALELALQITEQIRHG